MRVKDLTFELGDIAEWEPSAPFDVVFSNAALHWVDDHAALFARLTSALGPRRSARRAGAGKPRPSLAPGGGAGCRGRALPRGPRRLRPPNTRAGPRASTPNCFTASATCLSTSGCRSTCTSYPKPAAVVDWVKGTLLTDYRRRLPENVYDEFLARYRSLLISELPEERPYPFAFKRILLWGRLRRRGDDRNRTGVKGFAGPRVSHSATSPGRRRLATEGRHDRGYTGPALRM